MSIIAIIDFISFFGFLIASLLSLTQNKMLRLKRITQLFGGLFFLSSLYCLLLALEWSGITNSLERVEDTVGALIPMGWAFLAYTVIMSVDREKSEKILRESEMRSSLAHEVTHQAWWEWDLKSGESIFSPYLYKMLDETPNLFPPTIKDWKKRIHPDDLSFVFAELEECLSHKKDNIENLEFRILSPKGEWRLFSSSGKTVERNDEGKPIRMIGTFLDITEKKAIEKALLLSEQMYRELAQSSNSIILKLDQDSRFTFVNQFAQDYFGFSEEELIGKHVIGTIVPETESTGRNLTKTVKNIFDNPKAFENNENENVRKNGDRVWVAWRNKAIYDECGQLSGILSTGVDITKRKKAEEALQAAHSELENKVIERTLELAKAKEEAEQANQAKSVFIANMSHELRTPLNAILGFSQLMARTPDISQSQREDLDIINRSGEHLLNLINDVLEISKIEAGRITLSKTNFNLISFLQGIEEMFSSRTVAKGLTFKLNSDRDLPMYIKTDEGKLRQVVINILGNAVKYTDQGEITFNVQLGKSNSSTIDSGSVVLSFEICDSGIGIESRELEKIFEPFVQVGERNDKTSGTGLGLHISRRYIHLLGGKLMAESQLGKGSVFRFQIPVSIADADKTIKKEVSPKVLALEPGQPEYRILIVEDIRENRILLRRYLESVGFLVEEAADGQEALHMFEKWNPSLIFMDMRMPRMDGYEATRQIKSSEKGAAIPVIALTASALDEDQQKIKAVGCDDLISKPFQEDVLFDALKTHLNIRYCFEETKTAIPDSIKEQPSELNIDDLMTLTENQRHELKEAATELDRKRILVIVESVREQNPSVAEKLEKLAKLFQIDEILNLLSLTENCIIPQ